MKAIILAAGCGRRMGDLTRDYPKAMLPLRGKPLIEWQMNAIRKAGIKDIAIVKGYKGNVFTYPTQYFTNTKWDRTNMLSTLLNAEEWLDRDTCIISYSDIIYHENVINDLIKSKGDIGITFDPNWLTLWKRRFDDPLSDAETFKHQGSRLSDIGGRADSLDEIQGQYMGLLKFTPDGWLKVKEIIKDYSEDVIDKMDLTSLLRLILKRKYEITVTPINTPWCEIDSAADYKICQEMIESY